MSQREPRFDSVTAHSLCLRPLSGRPALLTPAHEAVGQTRTRTFWPHRQKPWEQVLWPPGVSWDRGLTHRWGGSTSDPMTTCWGCRTRCTTHLPRPNWSSNPPRPLQSRRGGRTRARSARSWRGWSTSSAAGHRSVAYSCYVLRGLVIKHTFDCSKARKWGGMVLIYNVLKICVKKF